MICPAKWGWKILEFKLWKIRNKFYTEWSEAKKKYRKIKEGPKNLNFGASKPGVREGARAPGAPLDLHLLLNSKMTIEGRMFIFKIFVRSMIRIIAYLEQTRLSCLWRNCPFERINSL